MQTSNDDTSYLESLSNQSILPVTKMTKTLACDSPNLSPTNSVSSCDLSPKNGSLKKQIRRRSRASKKTPTTHLNADTSNFRALVQQFTGCHTANTFLGAHKGPINLNFGVDENEDSINCVSSYEYDHYCNFKETSQREKKKKEKKIVNMKDQEEVNNHGEQIMGMLLVDHRIGSSSTTYSSSPTMDILTNLDDFELDNLSLHEFTEEFISTENIWDDGYLF